MESPESARSLSPALPPRAPVAAFVAVALLAALTWQATTALWPGVEFTPALRQSDSLWAWGILALFQLTTSRAGESAWLRRCLSALLLLGLALAAARQIPSAPAWKPVANQIEIALQALATLLTVARGLAFLAGREVRAGELWTFAGMQWSLVATAAAAALAATGKLDPVKGFDPWHRQLIAELWLFGAAPHAAAALALGRLPGILGVQGSATVRERSALVACAAHNVGAILLVLGWAWLGCALMLAGGGFLILAVSTLFKGARRAPAWMPAAGALFLIAAAGLRLFDASGFHGARMAAGAGIAGLAAVAVVIAGSVARNWSARGRTVAALGGACYVAGVATGVTLAISTSTHLAMHQWVPIGGALQALGVVLIAAAAARGRYA